MTINKDAVYLAMVDEASKMSHCPRRQFAALLVAKDGRLKGHAYNGTISGQPNLCGGDFCLRDGDDRYGHVKGCTRTRSHPACDCAPHPPIESGTHPDIGCIHAEANLIINVERDDLVGGTIYVNGEPCPLCAKFMAQAGISRLVYKPGGYPNRDGIKILKRARVHVAVICKTCNRTVADSGGHICTEEVVEVRSTRRVDS